MATRTETNIVYAAGLVQGIVLVTFPAASTIFTDPDEYDLSSSQYGAMFLPQVITAIAGSLLGSRLADRFGAKAVYLAGLTASLVAMGLLVASTPFTDDHAVAYPLLLVATACLGAGFGLTVPLLNTFTAAFHPEAIDRSVLVLNALLGLGTALGADLRGHLRRPRVLVGAPGALGDPAGRDPAGQPPAPAAYRRPTHHGRAPQSGRASRRASRCTPRSPCSMASARR